MWGSREARRKHAEMTSKTCIWLTELTFLGSSLNCVSSTPNAIILDKPQPCRPVPTTVINTPCGQVAAILPLETAQNGFHIHIMSCKDPPAIKELLAGAWIQSSCKQQPAPHTRFTHITRNGDKQSRTESSILPDQNWKSTCSPGNTFQCISFYSI